MNTTQILQIKNSTVFVDCDGTLVESFSIPQTVQGNKLIWWNENLDVTPVIEDRIEILKVLKNNGNKLVLWTNRCPQHEEITFKALGEAKNLFSEFQFHSGKKAKTYTVDMIVIDDDKRYAGGNTLTVEKK